MSARWTARIGLLCLLIVLVLPTTWGWWAGSRSWIPLEIPISLAPGHIKTEFSVNLSSTYEVQIVLDEQADSLETSCLLGTAYVDCSGRTVLRADWTLQNEGRVVSRGRSDTARRIFSLGDGIGTFNGQKSKHYSLDLEILADSSAVNSANPHLRIQEIGGLDRKYQSVEDTFVMGCIPLFSEGVILLVMAGVFRRDERFNNKGSSLTTAGPHLGELYFGSPSEQEVGSSQGCSQYFTWAQKLPLRARFSRLPSFGLVCALFLSWLVFVLMYFYVNVIWPKGVGVLLLKKVFNEKSGEFEDKPLVVRLRMSAHLEPEIFVNSKLVAKNQLSNKLAAELRHRSKHVVYIHGDSDLNWQNVADLIDIAQSAGADTVLLTPQTELNENPIPIP